MQSDVCLRVCCVFPPATVGGRLEGVVKDTQRNAKALEKAGRLRLLCWVYPVKCSGFSVGWGEGLNVAERVQCKLQLKEYLPTIVLTGKVNTVICNEPCLYAINSCTFFVLRMNMHG